VALYLGRRRPRGRRLERRDDLAARLQAEALQALGRDDRRDLDAPVDRHRDGRDRALALDIGDYKADMLRPEVNSQPLIEERLLEVVAACRAAGKVAGIGGFTPKGYAKWAREGYQFFTLGYVRDNNVQKFKPVLNEARDLAG